MVEAMDGKHSSLREELVTMKEQFSRSTLDKEVMEAEKTEVVEALTKVYLVILYMKMLVICLSFH